MSYSSRPRPKSTIPAKRSAADAQEDAWVADEDRFVLRQAKKKALIRVRSGRADPIDFLAIALRTLEPAVTGFDSDDDADNDESQVVDPRSVLESVDGEQRDQLEKGIDHYLSLEHSRSNREFWTVSRPAYCAMLHVD